MERNNPTTSIGFYQNFLDDERLRQSFLEFVPQALYGARFDRWFAAKAWDGKYQALSAYRLSDPKRIVSNVSYSKMRILVEGRASTGYQLATVGTLPEERRFGLARVLMERCLTIFPADALVFLFANSSVLDFYPKFGFTPYQETLFTKRVEHNSTPRGRQLDLNDEGDLNLLRKAAGTRAPVSTFFGTADCGHILLWHALYVVPNSFWWIPNLDTIVSCEARDGVFYIHDILWPQVISFKTLLACLPTKNCERIELGFTPDLLDIKFDEQALVTDLPLFVRGNFPLAGKKFKFPVLAQT